jgi:hypothetical protein
MRVRRARPVVTGRPGSSSSRSTTWGRGVGVLAARAGVGIVSGGRSRWPSSSSWSAGKGLAPICGQYLSEGPVST